MRIEDKDGNPLIPLSKKEAELFEQIRNGEVPPNQVYDAMTELLAENPGWEEIPALIEASYKKNFPSLRVQARNAGDAHLAEDITASRGHLRTAIWCSQLLNSSLNLPGAYRDNLRELLDLSLELSRHRSIAPDEPETSGSNLDHIRGQVFRLKWRVSDLRNLINIDSNKIFTNPFDPAERSLIGQTSLKELKKLHEMAARQTSLALEAAVRGTSVRTLNLLRVNSLPKTKIPVCLATEEAEAVFQEAARLAWLRFHRSSCRIVVSKTSRVFKLPDPALEMPTSGSVDTSLALTEHPSLDPKPLIIDPDALRYAMEDQSLMVGAAELHHDFKLEQEMRTRLKLHEYFIRLNAKAKTGLEVAKGFGVHDTDGTQMCPASPKWGSTKLGCQMLTWELNFTVTQVKSLVVACASEAMTGSAGHWLRTLEQKLNKALNYQRLLRIIEANEDDCTPSPAAPTTPNHFSGSFFPPLAARYSPNEWDYHLFINLIRIATVALVAALMYRHFQARRREQEARLREKREAVAKFTRVIKEAVELARKEAATEIRELSESTEMDSIYCELFDCGDPGSQAVLDVPIRISFTVGENDCNAPT